MGCPSDPYIDSALEVWSGRYERPAPLGPERSMQRSWDQASVDHGPRFLTLITPTLIKGLVCWPHVALMVGTGCTHGQSRHVACGKMTRPYVWLLASASESTFVMNMIAPVAPRWTVGAVMGFHAALALADCRGMMLSTTHHHTQGAHQGTGSITEGTKGLDSRWHR